MTPIQEKLMMLLEEIDGICKRHDIVYYLDGGSAIGALRHNGFIPWDDDIDIVFTRKNWNKFLEATKTDLPANRHIASLANDPHYTMVYARYCDTQSTNILITNMLDVFESGVFIDLFVLDPAPNDPVERMKFLQAERGFCEYLNPYYQDTSVGPNEWYDFFTAMGKNEGRDAVIRWMEENFFNLEEDGKEYYLFRFDLTQFVYAVKDFGTPRMVPFEGKLFPVPGNAENYLRTHYGFEWFMIPPAGDQGGHNVVINLDVPYRRYLEDYMKYIDYDTAFETYTDLHETRVAAHKISNSIDTLNCEMSVKACKKYYANILSHGEDPLKLLEEGKVDDVLSICDGYIARQTDKVFTSNFIIVDVDERIIAASLRALEYKGRHKLAYKIYTIRHLWGVEAQTEELKSAEKFIEDIMDLIRGQEKLDNDIIRSQYVKLSEYSELDFVRQAGLWLRISDLAPGDEDEELFVELEEACETSENEGYVLLKAEYCVKQGRNEEALKMYEELSNSRNGMMLQYIKNKEIELGYIKTEEEQ